MVKLYEHQELGKKYLLKQMKACLFFEVGTGKTYTALSALKELPTYFKVLIVAPKRVLEHVWKVQTEYDLSSYDVTYMNYEKISRDKTICSKTFNCIILDEVHKIKGKSTNISKRIKSLTQRAGYVWGLTGTPVANNYVDVYNIYKNMDITEFNMSYIEFCNTYYYVRPLERGIYSIPLLIAPKAFKIEELMTRIGLHSMTKTAEECVELPDKQLIVHSLAGMDTPEYKAIERGIFTVGGECRTLIKLEAINKAHQAANGFVYLRTKVSAELKPNKEKLEKLHYLVDNYLEESDKVIIVYYYKEDIEVIRNELSNEYLITDDINAFKNDNVPILLLQCGQAEGLNLQYCHHMIFYTFDYSFLKFDQMCGRIYRNGQKEKVTFDVLVNRGTIETKIWKAVAEKQSIDQFLKGALQDD